MNTQDEELLRDAVKLYCEEEIDKIMRECGGQPEVSDTFRRNMQDLINNGPPGNPARNTKRMPLKTKLPAKIACACLLAACVLTVSLYTDIGASCVGFIRDFLPGGWTGYHAADDADCVMKENGYALSHVPDGFRLVSELAGNSPGAINELVYSSGDAVIVFTYANECYSNLYIDNEKQECEHGRLADGTKCQFIGIRNRSNESILIWKKDSYMFRLTVSDPDGRWGKEELIRTADSVKEKE